MITKDEGTACKRCDKGLLFFRYFTHILTGHIDKFVRSIGFCVHCSKSNRKLIFTLTLKSHVYILIITVISLFLVLVLRNFRSCHNFVSLLTGQNISL